MISLQAYEIDYKNVKELLLELKEKTDRETSIKLTAVYITWLTIAKSNKIYPQEERMEALKNAQELLEDLKAQIAPHVILINQLKKNAKISTKDDCYYVSIIFPKKYIATAYGPFPPFYYHESKSEDPIEINDF